MKVLKIKIYQPSANYRIPFSYQIRYTYPVPPYSTLKGFICNLLGINNAKKEEFNELINGLSLAIYGKYETLTKEYIWFRNLNKDNHISKFGSVKNRVIDGVVQHPGGQSPATIFTLNNVNLLLYIYHKKSDILEKIKNSFLNPCERLYPLHLGRSEDWIVIESFQMQEINTLSSAYYLEYFTWIPDPANVDKEFIHNLNNYEKFFYQIKGNIFNLPVYYEINQENERVFTIYSTVKLFEGGSIPPEKFFIDTSENNIPLIFFGFNFLRF